MRAQAFKVELVSWSEITRLAARLAEQIRSSGFHSDIIIAIARGGYVPARLLCDHLDQYNLTSIRITHYLAGAHRTRQARLAEALHVDITGFKVLLVDDVDDSGDTLALAISHLREKHPAELKTAVLHHKRESVIVPDYYAKKLIEWRWLTYPWALQEDIQGFLDKLEPPPGTVDDAVARLRQEFGIQVPRRVLRELFKTGL